jgi:hypothetical protein
VASEIRTKAGARVPTLTAAELGELQRWQRESLLIDESRVIEGASFSFAMVVRYALGLTAEGGTIGALVRDCRAGHVVIATVRHLINAGAAGAQIVVVGEAGAPQSAEMVAQLGIVSRLGGAVFDYEPSGDNADFEALLKGSHNLLVGTFSPEARPSDNLILPLIEILNELPTPGHCVDLPFGVDPDSGRAGPGAMFASSTLSLGLPLRGALAGSDHLGRHYVADCGFPLEKYRELDLQGPSLFADQPVIQLVHE